MKRLQYFWEQLNSSFWFIPLLLLMAAIGASFGFISLDKVVSYVPDGTFKLIFPESAESARSVLSIIAGAMIGVAGTVFSITLVALTLASSQFGSRLLRNFMYDRLNQVVLGAYVSLFIYSLIVLNAVSETEHFQFVPVFSIMAAILVAIVNIFLLIIFIHHIAISIQSDKVISNISESLTSSIATLFPEEMGEEIEKEEQIEVEALKEKWSASSLLMSSESGYLQSIDSDRLMALATEHDLFIILLYKPGDYLVKKLRVGEVFAHKKIPDELIKKLKGAFRVGKVRTPLQDAEFAIHQMVEIAARALSPGVNDPYTAIACIDNLASVMCHLTRVKFPSAYRYDENGELRIVADSLTFDGMLGASFNQIRQFSEGSPSVVIRLMEVLIIISKIAIKKDHQEAIGRHAKMVLNVAEQTFKEPLDLDDLKKRYNKLKVE